MCPLPPTAAPHLWGQLQTEWEASLSMAKAALGEGAFATAWEKGQAMTLHQAVACALEEDGG